MAKRRQSLARILVACVCVCVFVAVDISARLAQAQTQTVDQALCYNAPDLDVVIESCTAVIQADSPRLKLRAAYQARSFAYEAKGDMAEARADAEQVMKLDPGIGPSLCARGRRLYCSDGQ